MNNINHYTCNKKPLHNGLRENQCLSIKLRIILPFIDRVKY